MIVGLTGGIGSGKSTVAKLFAILGAKVFNSDDNARDQYYVPQIKEKVIALLGKDSYSDDGFIDRKFISNKIFSDTVLLKQLNDIIHPAVKNDFKEFAKQHTGKLIIKESALLFELGLDKDLDTIILVTSPLELRIERVMKRDALTRDDVMKKINSQLREEEKIRLAKFIINNNEQEFIIPQVMHLYKELYA